ncbi:biotin transporter BioY [Sulfitobacter sp. HNIBRBA2951]|uniref:biotin transporter BioY n=1 Tax=Sulfitobacter aquimarinus TaxID=3158557 RepID=UPI0032E00FE0
MTTERTVAQVALFAALIAALGLIPQLTLAFGVPITAQSLGVMLCGTVLGAKRGGYAALLFVGLVAIGLPLLAGGRGGLGLFSAPAAGFLIGFPFAAFATGWMMERLGHLAVAWAAGLAAIFGGVIVLYIFGIGGLAIILERSVVDAALMVTAFIPGDMIKAVLAALITAALFRARPAHVVSRS